MAEIQIKKVPAMDVMSLSFTGPYEQTGDRLDELMSWMLRAGHPYSDRPFGLFYDNPENVAADDLRGEVCLPIEEVCAGYEEVERKHLPAVTVASMVFKGAPENLSGVYEAIFTWAQENGYAPVEAEPCREVYHALYGEVEEPGELVTEVQVPVQKV
jgi:AraC family transcriptional regulator